MARKRNSDGQSAPARDGRDADKGDDGESKDESRHDDTSAPPARSVSVVVSSSSMGRNMPVGAQTLRGSPAGKPTRSHPVNQDLVDITEAQPV